MDHICSVDLANGEKARELTHVKVSNLMKFKFQVELSMHLGDSGGPLVVKINNAYTVVGVISWGAGPGGKSCGGPGAYSKVSRYLNFINRIN